MKKLHLLETLCVLILLLLTNISTASEIEITLNSNLKDTCLVGDCNTGFGILVNNRNQKLIGTFKNGQLEGYGLKYAYGHLFLGEFKLGKYHGNGILQTTKKTIKGKWDNDKYISSDYQGYDGCQSGDCSNGTGIYVYKNHTVYVGDFVNGKAEGEGICYYMDGDVYYGNWSNHTFHGSGSFYFMASNNIQVGSWSRGKYTGKKRSIFDENTNKTAIKNATNNSTKNPTNSTVSNATKNESQIWAVVVGVAQYRHMQSLKYTDDDAYNLYSFLCSPEGGAVRKSNIKLLIDEFATKDNITNALKVFAEKADENDVLLFYFSGHGLPEAFLPIDYDGFSNKLLHKQLVPILKNSKAKSKIVIADACHSGGILAYKGEDYQTSINTYYKEIEKSRGGLVLFLSSKAEETSIENNGLRQGIFTHYLMKGLYGAANTNNDNIIRLDELFEYVQKNVQFYTNDYQTPMIYGDKSMDHPIAIIRN